MARTVRRIETLGHIRDTILFVAAAVALALCSSVARAQNADGPTDYQDRPAHFAVRPDVVNAGLEPFTATVGSFGNKVGKRLGGFEPTVWRNMYFATEDAPDRFVAGPALATYDTLREGFLDGGRIRIYRFEDGKAHLVRDETVPDGGFHVSGWLEKTGSGRLIDAKATITQYAFDPWNQPDADYYFCVRAVDRSGRESEASNVVKLSRPEKVTARAESNTVNYREGRDGPDDAAPAPPRNLEASVNKQNGVVTFGWQASPADDLAGYRLYLSYYPPEQHKGFNIQLAPPADDTRRIRVGDMAIVSKSFYTVSRRELFSPRVWDGNAPAVLWPTDRLFWPDENPNMSWRLVPYGDERAVPDGGETYIEIKLEAEDTVEAIHVRHAGKGQDFYDTLLPNTDYVVEFWLSGEAAEGSVVLEDNRYESVRAEFGPTAQWRQCSYTFSLPEILEDGTISNIKLLVTGPGTFCIDGFRVYRKDTPFLDMPDVDYQALRESGMMSLRTHAFIKTGTDTYDMAHYTNAAGQTTTGGGNTLPQTLKVMRKAGMRPWLQVEWHMAPDEWLGLIEYLAAPFDPDRDTPQSKPWAYKRYSQGQAKPWTEEFDRIYFELGNETWNWSFKPWVFPPLTDPNTGEKIERGEAYGMFQEHVHDVWMTSPYWESAGLADKIVWMVGGWSRSDYGHYAMLRSPSSDYQTIAAYNGGWDEGEGPPAADPPSFFSVLQQINQTSVPVIDANWAYRDMVSERTGREPYPLGTYEAGPGYAHPKIREGRNMTAQDIENQELTMKSLAAGTATLDSFLVRAYYDFDIQNFFTFSRNRYRWTSHAKLKDGGQAYPSWLALSMFNLHGTGDMLAVETQQCPTVDVPGYRRRSSVDDAPMVGCYATRKGDRVTLFVVSRKFPDYPVKGDDGFTPVIVDLPFSKCDSVTLYRMAGDPTATNLASKDVEFEKVDVRAGAFKQAFAVDGSTGADRRGLPPASTFIYVFEGTNTPEGRQVRPDLPAYARPGD